MAVADETTMAARIARIRAVLQVVVGVTPAEFEQLHNAAVPADAGEHGSAEE